MFDVNIILHIWILYDWQLLCRWKLHRNALFFLVFIQILLHIPGLKDMQKTKNHTVIILPDIELEIWDIFIYNGIVIFYLYQNSAAPVIWIVPYCDFDNISNNSSAVLLTILLSPTLTHLVFACMHFTCISFQCALFSERLVQTQWGQPWWRALISKQTPPLPLFHTGLSEPCI